MWDFYCSDTHFSHLNIIRFEPIFRPFKTIEEHDEKLVENWNKTVGPKDRVLLLGDFVFPKAGLRHLTRLNGIIDGLPGNHDRHPYEEYAKVFNKVHMTLVEEKNFYRNSAILWSHYPIHPSSLERGRGYNGHGHIHSHDIDDPRFVNLSMEKINLTPAHRDQVRDMLDKKREEHKQRQMGASAKRLGLDLDKSEA